MLGGGLSVLKSFRTRAYLFVLLAFISGAVKADPSCTGALRSLIGQSLKESQTAKRRLTEISDLKLGTYNTLNLMQEGKSPASQIKHQKAVALAILDNDLDIVTLQEINDVNKLRDFADTYLGARYSALITPGNDERGIQVGFLVKKDLPFQLQLETHADTEAIYPVTGEVRKIFSRDLPALRVWSSTQKPSSDEPLMVLYGTHFKSKRDSANDPMSSVMRRTQAESAATIISKDQAQNPSTLMMIAGDFNGDVRHEAEFEPLRKILHDAFDTQSLTENERITHSFHPRDGPLDYSQIDAFFLSPGKTDYIEEAFVYRYKDENGLEKALPKTFEERETNPSDHYPVILKLKFQNILKDRKLLEPNPAPPLAA